MTSPSRLQEAAIYSRRRVQADLGQSNPADPVLYTGEAYTEDLRGLKGCSWISGRYFEGRPGMGGRLQEESPLENVQYQGKQYALPFIGYYEGMFYNKALFEQYGLEEPTTWEKYHEGKRSVFPRTIS